MAAGGQDGGGQAGGGQAGQRDPIAIARGRLAERGELDEAADARIGERARAKVSDAVAFAEAAAPPHPATALTGASTQAGRRRGMAAMRLTYARAVALALAEAMADDDVFLLGEDIAGGGAYGATQGLLDRFGAAGSASTPISESAIVGYALGAALAGMRPVAEIMHMDFTACAMDQLVNQAAKARYMFGGGTAVPLTIRTGTGGWLAAAGPAFAVAGGLVHPHPRPARDDRGHTGGHQGGAAHRDHHSGPRHRGGAAFAVFGAGRGAGPVDGRRVPGLADVKRRGDDVTIVTWGALVPRTLAAADVLAADGIGAEVIDLLSLSPWDTEAVLASVARTGRLVVAHQAHRRGGFGAEIVATVAERCPGGRAPAVARVAGLDVPVPFSPVLEEFALPDASRIVDAVRYTG